MITFILTVLLQRIHIFTLVLQRTNPPLLFSLPTGTVFGPLTLADSPPSTLVDYLPPLCLEEFPCLTSNLIDPIFSDLSPLPMLAPTPLPSPSLVNRVFPCQLVSGCRCHPLSLTWTALHFKPPWGTFLLHCGLWNHAPWLDPLPTSFHPSSRAGQVFLWLCPPQPREPP